MPDHDRGPLASTSLARHLTRGAIGFGLIGSALALTSSIGPAGLLLAAPGFFALRGCPTCWVAGLIQTVSAGRVQRTCANGRCALGTPDSSRTRDIRKGLGAAPRRGAATTTFPGVV
jgi:hypothetical protein